MALRRTPSLEITGSRPTKLRRIGTASDPLVVSSSDDEQQGANIDHDDMPVEVDAAGEIVSYSPTQLFYRHRARLGRKDGHKRILPILSKADLDTTGHGKQRAPPEIKMASGWPTNEPTRIVNIYLEGDHFKMPDSMRHHHLCFRGTDAPDRSLIKFHTIRQKLSEILRLNNPLKIQLEVEANRVSPFGPVFRNGQCLRSNADWTGVAFTDNHTLEQALPFADSWLRVRVAEYIELNFLGKDYVSAVTPSDDATVEKLRELIGKITEIPVAAVRMDFREQGFELEDDMGKLSSMAFWSEATLFIEAETKECSNCLDDLGSREFPFEPITYDCMHNLDICKKCLQIWVTTCLDRGNWKNITCLAGGCPSIMEYADLQRVALPADMERFEKFSARDALAQVPGFKWCINKDCEDGQIHDDGGGVDQILTCRSCAFKRCCRCDRAWHQDETCEQYTARLAAQPGEVDASEAWVNQNSRPCPGCKSPIQKNDGCDHMTCTRCRRQFCWLCMADYAEIRRMGNTAHAENCRYHSGNIIDPHAPPRLVYGAAPNGPPGAAALRRGLPRARMPLARNPANIPAQPGAENVQPNGQNAGLAIAEGALGQVDGQGPQHRVLELQRNLQRRLAHFQQQFYENPPQAAAGAPRPQDQPMPPLQAGQIRAQELVQLRARQAAIRQNLILAEQARLQARNLQGADDPQQADPQANAAAVEQARHRQLEAMAAQNRARLMQLRQQQDRGEAHFRAHLAQLQQMARHNPPQHPEAQIGQQLGQNRANDAGADAAANGGAVAPVLRNGLMGRVERLQQLQHQNAQLAMQMQALAQAQRQAVAGADAQLRREQADNRFDRLHDENMVLGARMYDFERQWQDARIQWGRQEVNPGEQEPQDAGVGPENGGGGHFRAPADHI